MQSIDIKLNKPTIAMFKKTASLDADYIDFYVDGKSCIMYSENKGLVFAGIITLEAEYPEISFRISNQILKQVSESNSSMRLMFKENSIDIFIFHEVLSAKPIKISCLNSRGYIKSLDVIKDILQHKTISSNSFIQYMTPMVQVHNIISGLANKDLLISDGIVFIDNPEYKFFADLGKSGLNVIVPDQIVKQMKYELGNQDIDFIMSEGMCRLRCGNYVYCWKTTRAMQVNEYQILKTMKPQCRCSILLKNLTDFLQKLSIAKNRNQSMSLDIEHGVARVNENGILDYEIPISCTIVEGSCPSPVTIDMKSLLAVTKNLDNSLLLLDIHSKFIVFTKKLENNTVGDIPYSFLLRLGR